MDNPYSHEHSQNFLMNGLESMQSNSALPITSTCRGTSREKLFQELGWESPTDREWYRRLVFFFKVINGLLPTYLSSLLLDMREKRYDLRKTNSIVAPKCRTDA